jgi:DNA (cytosine-5)-methyltransferase 1
MGWENVFQVEKDEFCQKVLEKNFPNTKRYGDIKEFDGTQYRGAIDILTGGFPCQPFSTAGQRKGTEDDRYLWPEMFRIIREIAPHFIVGENVRGFINWSGGLVFEQVCADLEDEGYEVAPFLIPACGLNAPHRRDRIWIVAHLRNDGDTEELAIGEAEKLAVWEGPDRQRIRGHVNGSSTETLSNTDKGRRIQNDERQCAGQHKQDVPDWWGFPTQSPFRPGNDGLPAGLVRRIISHGGNAIVPQVAFEIFKAIEVTLTLK